jgi:hypothetical protein
MDFAQAHSAAGRTGQKRESASLQGPVTNSLSKARQSGIDLDLAPDF